MTFLDTSDRYLEENVAAAGVTLVADDVDRLDALEPAGDRYADMAAVRGESAALQAR